MENIDLNNIDFNNIGNWPLPVKIISIALLCAVLLGVGYYYDTQNQLTELSKVKNEEQSLFEQFRKKQRQANQLDKLKEQLQEIESSFGELLKRLPSKTEVPGLLVDISQTGTANNVKFELFKPQREYKGKDGFYLELPIKVTVTGDYHSFGKFVSDIAALQRIVTMHDITIKPKTTADNETKLIMTTTAKTYRYEDETEK